jgi:hypothetical protein
MSDELTSAGDRIVRQFTDICREDVRIQAAFLGGSRGSGTADAWADIDLYVVIADDDYDGFFGERDVFLDLLGATAFRETLNIGFDVVAFIMDSGVDGEVIFHRVSGLDDLHTGPIRPVIDRAGLLQGRTFPLRYPTQDEVAEDLPVVLNWFWRDALHLTRAIARDRFWTAYGFLEKLRGGCQYLIVQARRGDVAQPSYFVPFDGYEALDHIGAAPEPDMLRESVVPLEREALLASLWTLIGIYERIAPELAGRYGIDYPASAADVVKKRLDALGNPEA